MLPNVRGLLLLALSLARVGLALNFFRTPSERKTSAGDLTAKDANELWNRGSLRGVPLELAGYSFWKLCGAETSANLGGFGPDSSAAPELRYSKVGNLSDGVEFDLVLKNRSKFLTNDPTRNGRQQCFGKFNVASGTAVKMNFEFVKTGTNDPVTMDNFFITVYNVEVGLKSGAVMAVAMGEDEADFDLMPNTTIDVAPVVESETWDGTSLRRPRPKMSALSMKKAKVQKDFILFNGTERGNGADNPTKIQNLNAAELKKGISFNFTNKSKGTLIFKVFGGKAGRNFFFEGMSYCINKANRTDNNQITTSSCIVWGDPHIITFDVEKQKKDLHPFREAFLRTQNWKSDQISISDAGTFWLVHSERVQIQGTYAHSWDNPNATALKELAIGGPFLANNVLIIRPLNDNCTWNGEHILPSNEFPGAFVNELVTAFFHNSAELVKDGTRGPGLDITLPENIVITVNRWKGMMAAKITMASLHNSAGGQGGQCGNFNGDPSDDFLVAGAGAQDFLATPPAATKSVL